jgi:DNA primase
VAGLRAAAPLVAKIKDRALRPEYARKLAGDLGMEIETVNRAVASSGGPDAAVPSPRRANQPSMDDPVSRVEREALKLALQSPVLAGPVFDSTLATDYAHPLYTAVRVAIAVAGGVASATSGAVWVERVRAECADLAAAALVGELAVEPLLIDGEPDPRYVGVTLARLQYSAVARRVTEVKSKLQRMNPITQKDEYWSMAGDLVSLEAHARALREQAAGGL